jgi:hypothetical protein
MSHLEQLKAKISEYAYLSLLTEMTKAPSVSFVSRLGWHVLENEAVALQADPLSPHFPCIVCDTTDRWPDRGIWRCRQCWPGPLTQTARRAAEREQADLAAQPQAHHTNAPRPKPRDPRLGPVLPPCVACGELRYWHDHDADIWKCWRCAPPVPRKRDHVLLVGLCEPLDAPVCQADWQALAVGDLGTTKTTAPEEVR